MSDNGLNGDASWIRSALDRHEGPLTRYAQRITGDSERARDVVQETFLRLCREERNNLDGRVVEWLYTVCRNKAVDVRRKESRMTTLADVKLDESADRDPPPAEVAEERDSTGQVLRLLGSLPNREQEAIRLKFQHSLSYREIARVMDLSASNVGFLIHRGLKRIRQQIHDAD